MLKVVLDTNIYISALHFPNSKLRNILIFAEKGYFQLYITKHILAELRGVMRVKFKYGIVQINLLEQLLLTITQIVEPKNKINYITQDLDDNRILECASEANADMIISGDNHLLKIKQYRKIKIISADQFIKLIKSGSLN